MEILKNPSANKVISPYSNEYSSAVTFWGEDNCVCFAGRLSGNVLPKIRIGQKPGAFIRSPRGCLVYVGEGVSFQ